jgi:peroxiredoxin
VDVFIGFVKLHWEITGAADKGCGIFFDFVRRVKKNRGALSALDPAGGSSNFCVVFGRDRPRPEARNPQTRRTTMPLSIGSTAPDFTLSTKTAEGPKLFKLSDNFGKTNTLLLFFPMAFTSVCTEEFCSLSQGLEEYAALEASVVGISGDSPFAQEAWAQKEGITIPLLSDYEHKVAEAYGVAYSSFLPQLNLGMAGVAQRSAFIIDKNGVIQYAETNEDPKQLPDFAAIKAKLAELR